MTATEVSSLAAREDRVECLVSASKKIVADSIAEHVTDDNREVAAVVLLFSGGNDSTTLADIFHGQSDKALHCNTGIGVEQTRQFVRDTCESWSMPLIELMPLPGRTYVDHVMEYGFPGPSTHGTVFWKLKNSQIRRCTKMLNPNPYKYRVVYLGGRRRQESTKRKTIPYSRREGSAVFIDPLADWTALDLNSYRLVNPGMPHNEVTDFLHKSGECLCGCFANEKELDEIKIWYPDVYTEIKELETAADLAGRVHCQWGWAKRGSCNNGCNI